MDPTSSPLILASQSETRTHMLKTAGVVLQQCPANLDEELTTESMLAEGASGKDVAEALSVLKATQISAKFPDRIVLGADQVLVCEGRLFGKPSSVEMASEQLRNLRGKSHTLVSAAAVVEHGRTTWRHINQAKMTMRQFSDEFLDRYLDRQGNAVTHSVGGYKLEAGGAPLFSNIEGDYFTILGLPLLECLQFLRIRGVTPK